MEAESGVEASSRVGAVEWPTGRKVGDWLVCGDERCEVRNFAARKEFVGVDGLDGKCEIG